LGPRICFSPPTTDTPIKAPNYRLLEPPCRHPRAPYKRRRRANTSAPNGCKFFTQLDTIPGVALITIGTNTPAFGGSDKESIDSIRFNAPRNYDKQNRNVTENDYVQSITSQFSYIQAISVWGGEKNTTPAYGKVYISIKPTGGFALTDTQKSDIQAAIQPYNVMAIDTVFVDPTFNYPNC